MDAESAMWVGYIVGGLLSALVAYVVIRMAVTHAIVATRPKPAPVARAVTHADADGL